MGFKQNNIEGVGEVNMISFEGVGEMGIKNWSGGR